MKTKIYGFTINFYFHWKGLRKESSLVTFLLLIMKISEQKIILKNWQQFFVSKGIEATLIDTYMKYVKCLINQNLPPIFDFKHLQLLLGIKKNILASMINSPESYYRTFNIPKRSKGYRTINAPYPSLKYVQKWIYHNILNKIHAHGCAHGFISHRSPLTNVKAHINQQCLLKIDLKDFFPSIQKNWVIKLFNNLGYNQTISFYLASLCCVDDVLAQGSPASPAISNIVTKNLDHRLYRLSKKFNLNYTRYADDIAFSGNDIPVKFIDYANNIITNYGYTININKVRLYKKYGNKILTGISLSTGAPRLPRDYKRKLEKELFYIHKYGLNGHISHNKIRNPKYLLSLLGKVNYWLMIEKENTFAKQMQNELIEEYKKRNEMRI